MRLGLLTAIPLVLVAATACSLDTPITFEPQILPDATVSQPYSATITATDPSNIGVISIVATGNVPPGLPLHYASGPTAERSGTPTTVGSYEFTIVADSHGMNFGHPHGERQYTLIVH